MNTLTSWSQIPEFSDEKTECLFWQKNELDPRLMQSCIHEPDARESTTITLRFDPRMLSRIKRIARSRYLNYQSMMKQWLAERLEEEVHRQDNSPHS
jgi:predicted DNA binding CopG/RHH family protein